MSPVDPEKIIAAVKPFFIDYDRPCTNCGYNLVGLMSDGVCPECGRKIKIRKSDVPRYSDSLVNAPLPWLALFATGSLILFLASLGIFASQAVAAWLAWKGIVAAPLVAFLIGGLWAAGVWLVTRPRPVMKASPINPKKEWRALRWAARITQLFWSLTALLLAGYSRSSDPLLAWAAIPSFAVASLGLIPTCGLLSNLAYWASDSTLSDHFKKCAWTVGFAALLLSLHVLNIYTQSILMGGFWASMVVALLIFFATLPFFYIIVCCFLLQGTARWAVFNHATAEAKDERLRMKARQAAKQGPLPAPTDAAPVDLSAFRLGDSEVDPGLNAEALRRQGHVVQPKPHDETPIPVDQRPMRGPSR